MMVINSGVSLTVVLGIRNICRWPLLHISHNMHIPVLIPF